MSTTIVPPEKSQLTREEINRKQKEYIFPSVSTYYSDPLPMDHASMQHVWDVEGKKYLDFFGGIVTISVGHCNPRVTSRTKEQIDRMQHVSTCFPNVPMVDLAEKLAQITPGALTNRAVSYVYEPGSTFKLVTISAALEEKVTNPDEVFDCQMGSIVYNGMRIRDSKAHGLLPVWGVLAESSDVGAIKIALRLGEDRFYKYIRAYGFGQPTGIELPGETRGDRRNRRGADRR